MRGYTQSELDDIQAKWNLRFPPDLLALYREQRRVIENEDERFRSFDWISSDEEVIRDAIGWPFEGFLFDVRNGLWWPEWGEKPENESDSEGKFRAIFASSPKLIPIYGHRFLPQIPEEDGNPVFSVWQMDVIHYGANLADYVTRETAVSVDSCPSWPPLKEIPFWSRAVAFNSERFANGGSFSFLNKGGILP